MSGKIRGALLAPFWLAVGVFFFVIIAISALFDWIFKDHSPPGYGDD
jgi:hypothetical protein